MAASDRRRGRQRLVSAYPTGPRRIRRALITQLEGRNATDRSRLSRLPIERLCPSPGRPAGPRRGRGNHRQSGPRQGPRARPIHSDEEAAARDPDRSRQRIRPSHGRHRGRRSLEEARVGPDLPRTAPGGDTTRHVHEFDGSVADHLVRDMDTIGFFAYRVGGATFDAQGDGTRGGLTEGPRRNRPTESRSAPNGLHGSPGSRVGRIDPHVRRGGPAGWRAFGVLDCAPHAG